MLATFLSDIKDFRSGQGQKYELHNVILLSVMAICCNAKTFRQIAIFHKCEFQDAHIICAQDSYMHQCSICSVL